MAEYMGSMTDQPFVRSTSDIHAPQTPNKNHPWPRGSIARRSSNNTTGSAMTMHSSSSRRRFSVVASTEENHRSDAQQFYGPYAHIRKNRDYGYHKSAYRKERQWLQDSIIEEMLDPAVRRLQVVDKDNGDVCTTPTEPVCCFTAGAMGAGKRYTVESLVARRVDSPSWPLSWSIPTKYPNDSPNSVSTSNNTLPIWREN
eukprot:scaffold277943_cov53-Attheya_sp.AAC.1